MNDIEADGYVQNTVKHGFHTSSLDFFSRIIQARGTTASTFPT
jgi:hypothetical protein